MWKTTAKGPRSTSTSRNLQAGVGEGGRFITFEISQRSPHGRHGENRMEVQKQQRTTRDKPSPPQLTPAAEKAMKASITALQASNAAIWVAPRTQSSWNVTWKLPPRINPPESYYIVHQTARAVLDSHEWLLPSFALPRNGEDEALELAMASRKGESNRLRMLFHDSVDGALVAFQAQRPQDGGASLEIAFRTIREMLQDPHPRFLIAISYLFLRCEYVGFPDLIKVLAGNIAQHSRILFGKDHPLTCWADLITKNWKSNHLLSSAFLMAVDSAGAVLGKDDPLALVWNATTGDWRNLQTTEDIKRYFDGLLKDCDNSRDKTSRHISRMQILQCYADQLWDKCNAYGDAADVLKDIPGLLLSITDLNDLRSVVKAAVELANYLILDGQRNYKKAEALLITASERLRIIAGEDDALTLWLRQKLGDFYIHNGKPEEAQVELDAVYAQLQSFVLK